jgi:hypothetical protein
VIRIAPTVRTITVTTASNRSRVRSVSGRKIAKSSAFQTHDHFSVASTGNSAIVVVIPQ